MAQDRPAQIMPYLEIALQDQTADVVNAALKALVEIGDDSAAKLLSSHLLTNRQAHPAERVMEALSHFSSSVFESAVIGFLGQVDDVQLLWSVVKVVMRHHIVSALPQLHKMRADAPADRLEYLNEAIELLEGLGVCEGEAPLGYNLAEIRSRLSGKDVETRLTALDDLPHPLDPVLIPDLEKMLFDNDQRIRSKAAGCLHKLDASGIADKIRDEFLFMNLKEKYKAAEALWVLGDDSDHKRVASLLYDPRHKGVNSDIATMLKDRGMNETEIAQLTQYAQVLYLLEQYQLRTIEEAFDGTRDDLIAALEKVLEEKSHFGWARVFEQLKLIDWKPTLPHYKALLASDEEDPLVPPLDEDSARWMGDFVSMSQDVRQVTRMLRVLARGGNHCKPTLQELIGKGRSGYPGEIAPDMLLCFSREELLCLLESDNLKQAEFGLRVITNSDWLDKKDLVESRLRLALSNKEDHILQIATSLLYEIDHESAKRFMLETLNTGAEKLSGNTRGHFAELLGESGGGEARLVLVGQLMENQPGASKAAYHSLVKMGWSPSTTVETTLAALYKPDLQIFETLGEKALPQVLTYLAGGESCGRSILTYILRVTTQGSIDQELVKIILKGNWEYEAARELPKLFARCPDIATNVLLELIPQQRVGSGPRIRFTEYLSAVGTKKAIPLFLSMLTSKNEHEMKLAAMALGRLRHGPAVSLLGAALPNIRNKSAYSAFVKALAAIGGEEAVGLLRPLLPELQIKVLRTAVEKAIAKWETCSKSSKK
jgi:HEAT repeat protein